jgi:hypothetical protein
MRYILPYMQTLPQWLENIIDITLLLIIIFIVSMSFYFTYKIIKKIKDIKFKVAIGNASAEADIQIESPDNTTEIKQLQGDVK